MSFSVVKKIYSPLYIKNLFLRLVFQVKPQVATLAAHSGAWLWVLSPVCSSSDHLTANYPGRTAGDGPGGSAPAAHMGTWMKVRGPSFVLAQSWLL